MGTNMTMGEARTPKTLHDQTTFNVDQPGYRSRFAVEADATAVRFTLDLTADPGKQPVANVMVWLDGVLFYSLWDATAVPPRTDHQMVVAPTPNPGEVRVGGTILRGVTPVSSGRHELVVSAWAWPEENKDYGMMVYRRATVEVPTSPTPTLVPGKIVRVALWSEGKDLRRLGWVETYKAGGFNCIHNEFFRNPYYTWGVTDTIEKFREYSIKPLVFELEWCRNNGLMFWGVGDGMCRMAHERHWVESTPWAEQAIRETFAVRRRFRDVWVANSMVDEQPGHPNDWSYFKKICQWSREEDGPPMSWPNQRTGKADPWEADDVSDFADRYYSANASAWRGGKPAGTSGQPTTNQFTSLVVNTVARADRPLSFIASAMGPNYFKNVEGSNFSTGDLLLRTGSPPEAIPLQVFLPLAYKATAIRMYALDVYEHLREKASLGSEQQMACRPGSPEWAALSECNYAIARHEAALLGEWLPPGQVGGWLVGRRAGGFSFWINGCDRDEPCPGGPGGENVAGGRVVIYEG